MKKLFPDLGVSYKKIFVTYITRVSDNKITRIAAGISWNFFTSLFPYILFMLSLLPYAPHYDQLQFYIFNVLLAKVLPGSIQQDVLQYIQENILPNISKLGRLTLFISMIFGTMGTNALINGFNVSSRIERHVVWEFIIAVLITLSFTALLSLSLLGLYYSEVVLRLVEPSYEQNWLSRNLSSIISFVSFPVLYALFLSLFYWIGCLRTTRWIEALPGAVLASVIFVLLTFGFTIYVTNFAKYNVLYGSIGTILLFMVWLNVNINLILLGNEWNVTLKEAYTQKKVSEEIQKLKKEFTV